MNIDYNKNFLYNYNIFNKNNVGIGISTPKHTLDINGNLNLLGNLNIGDNIYLNNIINKDLNVLYYNQLTDEVKPIEIDNTQNNLYNWITVNNQLDFNYLNNIDNVIYNYISSEYYLDNTINLYIHTPIVITHLFIYKKSNQNKILDTDLGDLNNFSMNTISTNSTSIQKLNKYYYKLDNSIEISSLQTINFTSYPNDSYIKLIGNYKFNKGNTWDSSNENSSNIFVNRNINIHGINTNNNQLFVNGNTNVNYDLNINKISGDRELNNFIKSQLRRYENKKDSEIEIIYIDFESKFEKKAIARNTKGNVTRFDLIAQVEVTLKSKDAVKKVTIKENFKIDKIEDSVEESNYILIVKKDFSERIMEKLIFYIRTNFD